VKAHDAQRHLQVQSMKRKGRRELAEHAEKRGFSLRAQRVLCALCVEL
jgi:hypothetical protein